MDDCAHWRSGQASMLRINASRISFKTALRPVNHRQKRWLSRRGLMTADPLVQTGSTVCQLIEIGGWEPAVGRTRDPGPKCTAGSTARLPFCLFALARVVGKLTAYAS